MTEVLFVIPDYENIWENLGIAYISAYIKRNYRKELRVRCLHQRFTKTEKIISAGVLCDIVAFTATSPTYPKCLRICREIKKRNPSVRTVIGGHYPTAYPIADIDPCFDQMVIGEGEIPFLDILNGDFRKIVRPRRQVQWNELPHPDRDLVYNDRMVGIAEKMCGERVTSFQTKRVCPFRCVFCSERKMTGVFDPLWNPIRVRDVKDVMDEIEEVTRKYRLTMFKFCDATFDTSEKDVVDFCEEKIRRGNTMKWEAMVHATLMTEKMVEMMAKANCKQFNVGCESGSQRILNDIGKGVTVDKIIKVFDWGKKYGIERRGFFILGMPNEEWSDIKATDRLVERIQPDVFGITILCPYHGSDLWRDEFKNVDWEKADEYSNDFWFTAHYSNQELKRIQRYFSNKYNKKLTWHQRLYSKKK